jgi:hypothetical protein
MPIIMPAVDYVLEIFHRSVDKNKCNKIALSELTE